MVSVADLKLLFPSPRNFVSEVNVEQCTCYHDQERVFATTARRSFNKTTEFRGVPVRTSHNPPFSVPRF
jgi:hypothetical protein